MSLPIEQQKLLRQVPAIQRLLDAPTLSDAQAQFGREAVLAAAREVLNDARETILAGQTPPHISGNGNALDGWTAAVSARAQRRATGGVRRVINATGVMLHTGLGRAVLPTAVFDTLQKEMRGYAAVELDLTSGKRGRRDSQLADLFRTLLDCEDATAVNNNAAATLLSLAALARGGEVLVSRGQLVEIGGSFRMPDVMAESGATMVEVGATNRTHLRDYENAITDRTKMIMLVHTSNYRVIGFTGSPSLSDLVKLGRARGIPVVHDIGSGNLFPDLAPELGDEPVVKRSLEEGADLVLFSGDKIMGGPQAGIAAGRADLVKKMRAHPLYRAMRLDKLILRALETTAALYLHPEKRLEDIPSLRMLRRPLAEIQAAAEGLAELLNGLGPSWSVDSQADQARLGSGSLPEGDIPTQVVRVKHAHLSADMLSHALRQYRVPVIARIQDGYVLLDPRTLLNGEAEEIVTAFQAIKP